MANKKQTPVLKLAPVKLKIGEAADYLAKNGIKNPSSRLLEFLQCGQLQAVIYFPFVDSSPVGIPKEEWQHTRLQLFKIRAVNSGRAKPLSYKKSSAFILNNHV